jgi:hypothetical protein
MPRSHISHLILLISSFLIVFLFPLAYTNALMRYGVCERPGRLLVLRLWYAYAPLFPSCWHYTLWQVVF